MIFLKKYSLHHYLFVACILVSMFPNYELTFAVWSFSLMISLKKSYSATLLKYVAIYAAILVIAFISMFFGKARLFEIIRDFTYLVKPVIGMLVGYQLCRDDSRKALRLFVYTGVVLSFVHFGLLAYAVVSRVSLDMVLIREIGGYFSDFEIYALILLIFSKQFKLDIPVNIIRLMILVITISSFFYLARTNLIQFAILFIAMKGYFAVTARSLKVLGTIILVTLTGYTAIYYYNPKRYGQGVEGFLYKIKIAPIEPFKTKIKTDDWKDFNDNYRSYESIITVKQVTSKGERAVLLGEGLGSTLNLGREVLSNDGEYVQFIPIVHNGYMTVFLKAGIAGVILLLYFIVCLFRQRQSAIPEVKNVNLLLVGTSIFLIVSYWVFLGFYLKLDNKSIIVGFLLALKEALIREHYNKTVIQSEQ